MLIAFAVINLLLVHTGRLSYGADSEKKDFVDFYKTIMAFETGYVNDDSKLSAEDLMKLTIEEIKKRIGYVYQNLTCSYVFAGMHHMNLIKHYIDTASVLQILMFNSVDVFIKDEIVMVLNSMYDYGMVSYMNELLLLHSYMSHLQSLDKHEFTNHRNYFNKVHDNVYSCLEQFTVKCEKKNVYNDKHLNSVYYGELEAIKTVKSRRYEAINKSRMLIKELVEKNKAVMNFETSSDFHWYKLCLNGVVDDDKIMETLLIEFGEFINSKLVLEKIRANQYAFEVTFEGRLQHIGYFHYNLTNLFKITMLLIVRKHFMYVKEQLSSLDLVRKSEMADSSWELKVFRFYVINTKMLVRLIEFVNFMRLTGNKYFKYLAGVFVEPVVSFKTVDKVNGHIEFIEKAIGELQPHAYDCQPPLTQSLDNKYLYDLNMRLQVIKKSNGLSEDNISLDVDNFPMPESLHTAGVFVQYVKHILKGLKHDVIDMFLDFTRELIKKWTRK